MFGWTFAFYFHLLNGVRHLLWDSGRGLDIQSAYRSGYAVIVVAVLMSGLTFACVLAQGGGA